MIYISEAYSKNHEKFDEESLYIGFLFHKNYYSVKEKSCLKL
jgi:hypothetical protein